MYFWRTSWKRQLFYDSQKKPPELAIEMFKVNNGLSVQLVSANFHFAENHYNFRHQSGTKFKVDHTETETYGK